MRVTAPVRIDISAGWSDVDPFRSKYGGAVLNGAIDYRVFAKLEGRKLVTDMGRIPGNSGLGTSGAIRAAFLVAFNNKLLADKMDLIKKVHVFENQVLEQSAGLQDQAAAIFGGVNYWEFGKDRIKKKSIDAEKIRHLQNRLVLVYTGEKHLSSWLHKEVYEKKYRKNVSKLKELSRLAREMAGKIGNESAMEELLHTIWKIERSLYGGIETHRMRKLQTKCDGNYLASRSTGAGGGGCMIFYTSDKQKLVRKLAGVKWAKVLPFKFEKIGLKIER